MCHVAIIDIKRLSSMAGLSSDFKLNRESKVLGLKRKVEVRKKAEACSEGRVSYTSLSLSIWVWTLRFIFFQFFLFHFFFPSFVVFFHGFGVIQSLLYYLKIPLLLLATPD